jgi:hypothetical protein
MAGSGDPDRGLLHFGNRSGVRRMSISLITRIPLVPVNAKRRNSRAVVKSRFGESMKSIVGSVRGVLQVVVRQPHIRGRKSQEHQQRAHDNDVPGWQGATQQCMEPISNELKHDTSSFWLGSFND